MTAKQNSVFISIASLIVLLTGHLCASSTVEGSWLIDARQFHVSAHGRFSCLNCHGDIPKKELHPNPAEVNKEIKDFFNVDQCARCHSDVIERIDKGFHKRVITNRDEFFYCIGCHDPHYQQRLGDPVGQFDPSIPLTKQCGACHKHQEALPPIPNKVEACMSCHSSVEPGDPRETEKVSRFCFHCHSQRKGIPPPDVSVSVPLIDMPEYEKSLHAQISCLVCHPNAARFNHANQVSGDCRQCHLPHDEEIAHDAHMIVSCESCHLAGITPIKNPESKQIKWEIDRKAGVPSTVHTMTSSSDDALCRRCHFPKNQVGAAAHLLPAKSIICMPCHSATLSWTDSVTVISLVAFLLGFVSVASVWFSGTISMGHAAAVKPSIGHLVRIILKKLLSLPLLPFMRGLILDVFLQMRLFRQSKTRWVIHALIFLPFVFRFFWGLGALIGSLWHPESGSIWKMLDKNHATTAFLFDITGVMILVGVGLAFLRGIRNRSRRLSGLPSQDHIALALIAGIVVVGFILEGVRMAMTGWPGDATCAFIGHWISIAFAGAAGLTEIYGYVWYLHAILTGAFLIYLPFSRLLHIVIAPVVLTVNACGDTIME